MSQYRQEAPALGHRDREFRGIFSGFIPITVGMIFFILGTYLVLNGWHMERVTTCQSRLYIYPNAEIVSRVERTITQPFGIIETRIEMTTPDDEQTVQSWYSSTWGRNVRQMVQNRAQSDDFVIPQRGWEIEPAPNGGSLIHLTGYCP